MFWCQRELLIVAEHSHERGNIGSSVSIRFDGNHIDYEEIESSFYHQHGRCSDNTYNEFNRANHHIDEFCADRRNHN
jgi:hypothetical protein